LHFEKQNRKELVKLPDSFFEIAFILIKEYLHYQIFRCADDIPDQERVTELIEDIENQREFKI